MQSGRPTSLAMTWFFCDMTHLLSFAVMWIFYFLFIGGDKSLCPAEEKA